jgi:DNA replicative helicase MCM subunit Mcm2 (Cdc46/Mcm family)
MILKRVKEHGSMFLLGSGSQVLFRSGLVILLLFLFWEVSLAKRPLKDPPVSLTIEELMAGSDHYDGQRVIVTGRVRSMEIQKGRRGSNYVMVVIEELGHQSGEAVASVNVIILNIPSVREGNDVRVQGVYHREGRQAGKTFEHFIDAEAILKDKL